METTKVILVVLISLSSPIFLVAYSNKQKTLTGLRRFKVEGVAGRFIVDRSALEQELQNRKLQDAVCGHEVKLELPQSVPHQSYDTSHHGEVILSDLLITDHTLASELSNELKEQVATSYRLFGVAITVVPRMAGKHAVLNGHMFTNETKKVLPAFFTNYKNITQVNSIEEEHDGTVRIRVGDDVMVYQVQEEIKCRGANMVGKDFDGLYGKIVTATNYPLPFDWGCDLLGSQVRFCQAVNEIQCELATVGGDVCALTSTSSSRRCPTSMKIVNMTGIFRRMFPFLAETVPAESFEAGFGEREHTAGITFPCLTR